MTSRRVVVTGIGAVTPLALDARATWSALLARKSGAGPITRFDPAKFDVRIAAEVKGFEPAAWVEAKEVKRIDRFAQFGIAASAMAVQDAGLDPAKEDVTRCGVVIGSGIGGLETLEEQHTRFMEKGPDKISPFLIPKLMGNAAAGLVSIRFGFKGPSYDTVSACTSAANAMGDALRLIQRGDADLILTGGTEATVTHLAIGGFANMRALSPRNDAPELASRPFDKDRDGFLLGEGAGVLVFEEYEHARKRGARIYAEVLGFGMSSDAGHITAPDAEGTGAQTSMRLALADAQLAPDRVDYVNAHGTSTPLNDKTETLAIKRVFGAHARKLAISSTKSMIGHLLGASGGAEAVVCALSILEGKVHPTLNLTTPDPDCDLDYVPGDAREMPLRAAISNSFGFGGHNATIVFGKV